jgi:hypothetical protein
MQKFIFLLISLSFLVNSIHAQNDFRKGFIIKSSNDTLYGLINFRTDLSNSKQCEFSTSENASPIIYKAEDINGYRFLNDKYFVSKTVLLKGEQSRVFLEYLVNGIVDLYCLKTQEKPYFFMQKDGGDLIEISENEELVYTNGNVTGVKKDKKYTGKLKILFADTPQLYDEIDQLSVDRKSLIKISKDYHAQVCTDSICIIYEKKITPSRINIGPAFGISSIYIIPEDITFRTASQKDFTFNCDFAPSNSLSYGLFFNITLPSKKDRLKLQYEGLISTHTFSSSYTVSSSYTLDNYEKAFSLSSTDLSHYLSLYVSFYDTRLKPVLQVGCFANQKLKLERTGFNPNGFLVVEIFPPESYFGFSIGMGCTFKINEKKDLQLKATYSQGYGSYIYMNTRELSFAIAMPIIQFKL